MGRGPRKESTGLTEQRETEVVSDVGREESRTGKKTDDRRGDEKGWVGGGWGSENSRERGLPNTGQWPMGSVDSYREAAGSPLLGLGREE